MKKDRLMKDALYFHRLKKEKRALESDIRVHSEWLSSHPRSIDSKDKISESEKKIVEIDVLLAKEPPTPELPPRQPLIKVSGVLEEIDILLARGFFSGREYEPEEFERNESNRLWGSVILAAVGESAAAAVHSQDDIREADVYDFVKGKINGKPFYGWLGRTTAIPGDYIELAAIDKNGHYEVYALALPKLRTVSMFPRCYQAIYSKALMDLKSIIYLPFGMAAFVCVFGIFFPGISVDENFFIFLGYIATVMMAYCIIASPFAYYRNVKKPNPINVMAQRIFTALEMKEPEKINLEKITKEKSKHKSRQENQKRIMPDYREWVDYYYYYY
ncbi:putative type VI secretion system effector [Pantoea sp. GD03673]|uniref:putative type VI secretion system effector n=1 Tax=Pantoea sp. GD03673 TaxID=2975364 RepID=UPI00244AACF3|nr:putative type VI secretion system effector [Pantoea sp. GD03673]MDH2067438.1 hypothetical protein [Pantoea sp. GD03673]